MNLQRKTICIYGASSSDIAPVYAEQAKQLGKLIGAAGASVICGGGRAGLMGAVTDGTLAAGGNAIGVLPSFMIEKGWQHPQLTEMVSTETMHERKMMMAQRADAAIALPGGVGTFDELFEIITWRQLGLFRKPLVILNTNNYYTPLLGMLEHAAAEHFVKQSYTTLFYTAHSPEDAIRYLSEWTPECDAAMSYSKSY